MSWSRALTRGLRRSHSRSRHFRRQNLCQGFLGVNSRLQSRYAQMRCSSLSGIGVIVAFHAPRCNGDAWDGVFHVSVPPEGPQRPAAAFLQSEDKEKAGLT